MTEPPEPRRPEEGGGDDPLDEMRGYEIEDEEMPPGEWLDLLEEDAALDALHNAPGEADSDLARLAEIIKDAVDDRDIPMKSTGRAERGEDVLNPPKPGTGDQSRMINEGAQILANIASNGSHVQGMVNAAEDNIRSAVAALQEAVTILNQHAGEAGTAAGGTEGEQLNGLGQSAASALDTLLSAAAMFDPHEAQGQISQFYDAVGQAAQKHGS